jgi:uncharacterized membrane protein (UPF0136 family)
MFKNMKLNGLVVLLYGLIILVGGIMGHVKAGSNASLISGLLFGSILIASAWLILLNKKSGLIFALFSTVILDGFFTFRFLFTKKFLPPGFF